MVDWDSSQVKRGGKTGCLETSFTLLRIKSVINFPSPPLPSLHFLFQLHVVEFQSGSDKYQDIVDHDKIRLPNNKYAHSIEII